MAVESELAYVYIYIYTYVCVMLRNAISGAPRGQHVFKMVSPPVTQILTLHFWRIKDHRFGQVDHFVLPRMAYYSSNTIRVCVACFSRDLTAGDGPSVPWQIERYERKFQAAKPGLFVSAIADR